jgi:enamine deaminase RidA (YjgF/YER057c/UK114 family)
MSRTSALAAAAERRRRQFFRQNHSIVDDKRSDAKLGFDEETMAPIIRLGCSRRWSDVVIHGGLARWVEVAEVPQQDARGQIAQILGQIDATLAQIGSDRTQLLQITIFLADLTDAPILNELWDAWVPGDHPPIRACMQAGLAPGYRVEMIVTAAAP